MEGIGLDNMLGAEEVEKLIGQQVSEESETTETWNDDSQKTGNDVNNKEAAEVDFSNFIGEQPESVGSEENSGGHREASESSDDSGTPQQNLFSSIAKALRDEDVFPDLSDEEIEGTTDAAKLRKLFDDQVGKSLDERQQRLEKLANNGATPQELQDYQTAVSVAQFLESKETYETLVKEGEEGERLRRQMMFQDYTNRGFKEEKAKRLIEKSIEDGSDIEDAKEAFESCKEFYKNKVEQYQQEVEDRKKKQKEDEQKQFNSLQKRILETESFFGGIQVDKNIRQKAYDSITVARHRDAEGNYLTDLQKYQKDNPMEFLENVAMLYSLTDGFKNVEKLVNKKVKAGIKKGFEDVANILNNSKRNGDGTLNLANTAPDLSEREKWTLAI